MTDPYALHMPHWPKPTGPEPSGTPAERVRTILAKLGHPERKLPPVVHVGGTKGKGSTIAFLGTMLSAAGYKVHCYTSPHIDRFNERIELAGRPIDDALLFEVLEEVRVCTAGMEVGFFDATTAAAVLAFARMPADVLLMEMGLGGRVDATHFLDNPLLTILTTLSYDHMEYMGTTLAEISAFESGLFRPHVPSVVSFQHESVWPVLEEAAAAISTPLYAYGKHWLTKRADGHMIFSDAHGEASLPLPSLLGIHQIVNAGNAIAAVSALHDFDVAPEHIMQSLLKTAWKGRLEQVQTALLPKGSELWFDGGHNMAAAQAIALHASEYWQDQPLYMVFGTSQGKDIASMVAPFVDLVHRLYAVEVKSEPKSYSAQAVTNAAGALIPSQSAENIADALHDIRQQEKRPFRVLVFGSLYLWLETKALLG